MSVRIESGRLRVCFAIILGIITALPLPLAAQQTDANAGLTDCGQKSSLDGYRFSGCGSSPESARDALAKSIRVKTSSTVESSYTEEERTRAVNIQAKLDYQVREISEIDLTGQKTVKVCEEPVVYCAGIKEEDLKKGILGLIDQLRVTKLDALPTEGIDRMHRVDEILHNLHQVRSLSPIVNIRRHRYTFIDQLEKQLLDIRKDIKASQIVIRVNIPGSTVDIRERRFSTDVPIPLGAGTYDYIVTAPGHCPIKGNFELDEEETNDVQVKLKGNELPRIRLVANHPTAWLKVQGRQIGVGRDFVFKRCDGGQSYTVQFEGRSETGVLNLRPGMKHVVKRSYLSRSARKKLLTQGARYRSGSRVAIMYEGASPLSGVDTAWVNQARFDYARNRGPLTWGGGIRYGQNAKDSLFDGFIRLGLQFTHFGQSTPLNLWHSKLLIPYMDFAVGFGRHRLHRNGNETTRFGPNFVDNHLLLESGLGLLTPISTDIGLDMRIAHGWTMERPLNVGIGLVINLN